MVGVTRKKRKCALRGENGVKCARKSDIFGKCVDHVSILQEQQDVEYLYVNSLTKNSPKHQAFVTFKVNQTQDVSFQIDTGATCNVMPFGVYKNITRDFEGRQLNSTKSVLMMHNKSRGTMSLQLDRNGHGYRVKFLIVDNCKVPLLSLVTSKQLSLVKIMDSDATTGTDTLCEVRQVNVLLLITSRWRKRKSFMNIVMFLKVLVVYLEYNMTVDQSYTPLVHAPRRLPIAIRELVQ